MGTHFLSNLAILGKEKALALEPAFDFYRASKVISLSVAVEDKASELPSLRLNLAYAGNKRRYELRLHFIRMRELELPKMAPELHIPELEIEDVRPRKLEGIGFEACSQLRRDFRCACADLSILSFKPI